MIAPYDGEALAHKKPHNSIHTRKPPIQLPCLLVFAGKLHGPIHENRREAIDDLRRSRKEFRGDRIFLRLALSTSAAQNGASRENFTLHGRAP